MKSVINHNVKRAALMGMMCLLWMTVQAQVKVCVTGGRFFRYIAPAGVT